MPWLDIYRLERGGTVRRVSCASITDSRGPGAMRKMLEIFFADRRGNIALIFAFVFPVVLMVAGFSVDYGMAMVQQKRLQSAVDAGAIAAAKEVNLADRTIDELKFIAESTVFANLNDGAVKPTMSFFVSTTEPVVLLTAVQKAKTFFGGIYGNKIETVAVRAEAVVVGSTRICVLALDPAKAGAVSLEQSARITGNGCAVYSNSTNRNSIKAKNSARLITSLTCSAGGYSGAISNYEPEPLTDCPTFADQSAYTAIVVRELKLFSGPNLVLNTNYGASDIPVPAGIKGIGNQVALIK